MFVLTDVGILQKSKYELPIENDLLLYYFVVKS